MAKKSKLIYTVLLFGLFLSGCGQQGPKGEDGVTPTITINDQNHWVINGVDTGIKASSENGKSAYQIYCENHPGYDKSEEEWIAEFCKKDNTDYSTYADFNFIPTTYSGVKGYTASYIGKGGNIKVPETFNCEPVLGFKFGFDDMYSLATGDPDYFIASIHFPANIKFFALNGNSEYARNCLDGTALYFTASIDEALYSGVEFHEIYFDGSLEQLQNTNIVAKFPNSNISIKSGDSYVHKFMNYDKFLEKYHAISSKVQVLQLTELSANTIKFDDGELEIPNFVEYEYENTTYQIPLKVVVKNENEACSVNDNKITYKVSKLDKYIGQETFFVDFVFTFEGKEYVGASSTIIVSKTPNKFRIGKNSFDFISFDGSNNTQTQMQILSLVKGTNTIKGYYEDEYGIYETAIPQISNDGDYGCSPNVYYDASHKSLDCLEAGDYLVGFEFVASRGSFLLRTLDLSTFNNMTHATLIQHMQHNYSGHGNNVFVKETDIVTIPSSITVAFNHTIYTVNISVADSTGGTINCSNNVLSFNLSGEDSGYSGIFYTFNDPTDSDRPCTFVFSFNITK